MITPKNWKEFQHYKNRKPAWIKLHHALLDDFEYSRLPVASRALAPCLWLLASEYQDGAITAAEEEIAFRLRMTAHDLFDALMPLVDAGFFIRNNDVADCYQPASTPLAEVEHVASLEREEEREIEEEKDAASSTRMISAETELFRRGKEILGPTGGGFISKLVKAKSGNVAMARAAIEIASTKQDPREYIGAIIRGRDSPEDLRSRGEAW